MVGMMGSWTSKMGFPVVKVESAEGSSVVCEQCWFLADGSKQDGDDEKLWDIPIFAGSDKSVDSEPQVLRKRKETLTFSSANAAKYFKLNYGQHCAIRVLYPEAVIRNLASHIQSIPAVDRIGLLSDSYALCKAGLQDPDQLVELLSGFSGESNDKVWSQLATTLGAMDKLLKLGMPQTVQDAFAKMAAKLTKPAFASIGWDTVASDTDNSKKLRSTMATLAGKFCWDDPDVMNEVKQRVTAFVAAPSDSKVLSADVRAAVLTCAMKAETSHALFDQLVEIHNKTDDGAVRQHIYGALGSASSPALRKKALAWALTDDVRNQDVIYLPMYVGSSCSDGADELFEWLKTEYDQVYRRIGETSMMLFMNVVKISGMGFASNEKADEVQKFWESKAVVSKIRKALEQTIEGIKSNAEFLNRLKSSKLVQDDFWKGFA
jgi:aminopeptidase N